MQYGCKKTPIKRRERGTIFSLKRSQEVFQKTSPEDLPMAQAAVTLQAQNFFHRHPSRLSCRRRSSDDESSLDEDPSWQPSEFKPRRKRRCRDVHSQQVCTSLPHSPPAVSPYSCVPAANTREGITVELTKANNDLWENFRSLGTEMIICKEGRSVISFAMRY